jgi:carboxymethylenebutenolidase
MGRRLAAEGYAVLVPNPYYRMGKAPLGAGLSFTNPDDRAKLGQLMGSLTTDVVVKDAKAYVGYLDSQQSVTKMSQIGVQGYCMGGRLTMITAATAPLRVGAGASFHGGGVATDKPDSPHLMVSEMKAQFYFGISSDDDQKQPDMKDKLKVAFASARLPAEIKVYDGALHGWCVPDMPPRDGKPVYDQAKAEEAWTHLLALYRKALA